MKHDENALNEIIIERDCFYSLHYGHSVRDMDCAYAADVAEQYADAYAAALTARVAELEAKQGMQPVYIDEHGSPRFKSNRIIKALFTGESPVCDLNYIAKRFPDDEYRSDHEQIAQLIGYSLSGFSELSYVSDECFDRANFSASILLADKEAG